MFSVCSSLTSLDLSGFDTSNVSYYKDMGTIFSGCNSLADVTLSGAFSFRDYGTSVLPLSSVEDADGTGRAPTEVKECGDFMLGKPRIGNIGGT